MRLLLLCAAAAAYDLGDVEHFLVLFYENRAFDHIFGCAKDELPGIDGLPEGAGNWLDPNDHSKGFVPVECGSAQYVCQHDEDHSFPSTTTVIFGPGKTDGAQAPYPNVTMGGYANRSHGGAMTAFAPEQLPIKIALAKEFGVFNNFYASIPGPRCVREATACTRNLPRCCCCRELPMLTQPPRRRPALAVRPRSQPNHMFAQSATSCGATETGTVYEQCAATEISNVGSSPTACALSRTAALPLPFSLTHTHFLPSPTPPPTSPTLSRRLSLNLAAWPPLLSSRSPRRCGGVLPLFPQKTIYESFLEAGREFNVFYNGRRRTHPPCPTVLERVSGTIPISTADHAPCRAQPLSVSPLPSRVGRVHAQARSRREECPATSTWRASSRTSVRLLENA